MIQVRKVILYLCVALAFTGIGFLKIGFAKLTIFHALVPITAALFFYQGIKDRKLVVTVPRYFWMFFLFIVTVNVCYFNEIKVSSFVFTLVILMELLFLFNLVKKMDHDLIRKILKTILLFYFFINLVVGAIFIFMNYLPGGLLGSIIQIYDFDHRIRPYGFSDEPSYAAIILVFTFYVFLAQDRFKFRNSELKWYIIAVASVLLTQSSYGYMMLALVLLVFLIKGNVVLLHINTFVERKIFSLEGILRTLMITVVAFIILFQTIDFNLGVSVARINTLIGVVIGNDSPILAKIKYIEKIDGSAGMRIVPTMHLVNELDASDLRYVLFGRGAGQSIAFFTEIYEGQTTLLGFIPTFIYNYGLIGTILFFALLVKLFPRSLLLSLLLILILFNADFNTQIFLFVLFCGMLASRIQTLDGSPTRA